MNFTNGAWPKARPLTLFMLPRSVVILLSVCAWLLGCSGPPQTGPDTDADPARAIVRRAIDAHGGMDAWNRLRDVNWRETFLPFSEGKPETPTVRRTYFKKSPEGRLMIRLEQRDGRIEQLDENSRVHTPVVPGLLVTAFDGRDAWWSVDGVVDTSERGKRYARYITKAFAYWFALPFKLLDPGVTLKLLEPERRYDKDFDRVEVTFDSGVGDNPTDGYIYLFDRETGRIHDIDFWRVGRRDTRPRLGQWRNYEQVGGIWKETLRIFTNAKTREKASERRFMYLQVNSGLPDRLFQATEAARAVPEVPEVFNSSVAQGGRPAYGRLSWVGGRRPGTDGRRPK